MTLTPVKPNPNTYHHVYLGWDSSNVYEVLAIGPNMTIVLSFDPFLPYEKGVTKGCFDGVLPLQPLYYPL